MKALLISQDERHSFLLEQLEAEGNEVRLMARRDTGAWRGLVERVHNLEEAKAFGPDLVLIDTPGQGALAKLLQDEGFKVFGGSKLQDKLADNYLFGMSLLENAGVDTLDYTQFTDVTEASEYINGKHHPWMLRHPDGTCHNCKDDIEMQLHLEGLYQNGGLPKVFTLQKGLPDYVDGGMALRPQYYLVGLFNSEGLMNPALRMDIARNILPDGQGVPTIEGCQVTPVKTDSDLPKKTLKKLEKTLQGLRYTGWVFLGCTADWDGDSDSTVVVDFQMTPPDGFWAACARGLNMRLDHFLDRALNPKRPNTPFEFYPGYVTSRKLTLPPYPYTEAPWVTAEIRGKMARTGIPKTVFHREKWGVYWNDVFATEDGKLEACGPLLGYVVGRGETYESSAREAQKIAMGIPIQYAQVKVDDSMAEINLSW